jgi:hypothetical protein
MKEHALQIEKDLIAIKANHTNGEKLSFAETEIFCLDCIVANKSLEDLPNVCESYKFSKLYLIYYTDLSFKSQFIKPNYGANIDYEKAYELLTKFGQEESEKDYFDNEAYSRQRLKELELGITKYATSDEVLRDQTFLKKIASEWDSIIDVTNHTDQNLQAISKEARDFKKLILKKFDAGEINEFEKNHQINLILWKTKHIHETAEMILEEYSENPYPLILNGVTVYFNYVSLIHILNRHFGELVSIQMFRDVKSFHNPIFQPNKIHLVLENIFKKLSSFEKFKFESITFNKAFNFKFRETNYQFYLKSFGDKKDKLFVSSIYPLENEDELGKLKDYNLYAIDTELSIYLMS